MARFFVGPLTLCQFTPAEKPPLKSSLYCRLAGVLLQDLNVCSSERFIVLLIQNGTADFKTGCEALMLPALALSPTFKYTAVFPAEPRKLQTSSRKVARTKGPETQTGRGCSAVLSTALFGFWGPELGAAAPQNEGSFIAARLGFLLNS